MKTYDEIDRIIRENNKKINATDELVNGLNWREKDEQNIIAALNEQELLKIENKILHDNARRAYFSEVIGIVVAEFQKYKGKPYGDKTKDKISDACKEKASCAAYISYHYGTPELHIIPLDKNGFSGTGRFRYGDFDIRFIGGAVAGDGKKFLIDNKIQEFTADELDICYGVEYVEDVRARAELIKIQFAEVKKAWDAYNNATSAFNRLVPSGIENVNPYNAPRQWLF